MKYAQMQPQFSAHREQLNAEIERASRKPEIDAFNPPKALQSQAPASRLNALSSTDQYARDELVAWAQTLRVANPQLIAGAKLAELREACDPFRSPPTRQLMRPFVRAT